MKTRIHQRSGAVLVCVLACCLTAISVGATAIQLSLRSARESKQTLRLRQAQWLLQAGVQRALQRLTNPDYTGEVWTLPLTNSLGTEPRIVIDVAGNTAGSAEKSTADDSSENTAANSAGKSEELAQRQGQTRVTVTAEYSDGAGGELTIRRSHTFMFRRPSTAAD